MKTKKLISALAIAVFALTSFSLNANAENEKTDKEIWQELCKIKYTPFWAEWHSPTNSFNLFMKVKDDWIINHYKRIQENLNKAFWIWNYTEMIESWKFKKSFDRFCKEERFEEVVIEYLILTKAKNNENYKSKLDKVVEEFNKKETNYEMINSKTLEKLLISNIVRLKTSKDILTRENKKQCDAFSAFDVRLPTYDR